MVDVGRVANTEDYKLHNTVPRLFSVRYAKRIRTLQHFIFTFVTLYFN
jgi:hypothetical protein